MKNKKIITVVVGLLVAALAMFGVWRTFAPKAAGGEKQVVVHVIDDAGADTSYAEKTDAEYLSEVMDELAEKFDFSYEGATSEYGLFIDTINGVKADYDKDGAYWAIYVNDEYGQYGADSQPVADGDVYKFVYEKY